MHEVPFMLIKNSTLWGVGSDFWRWFPQGSLRLTLLLTPKGSIPYSLPSDGKSACADWPNNQKLLGQCWPSLANTQSANANVSPSDCVHVFLRACMHLCVCERKRMNLYSWYFGKFLVFRPFSDDFMRMVYQICHRKVVFTVFCGWFFV